MLAQFNPDLPDWIIRTPMDEWCADNPDDADAVRALAPGCALALSVGGGGFVVVVHETDNYRVAWASYDDTDDRRETGETGEYIGLHHGRPEPIEWEAL